jgi:predicted RecB family nuclease
VIDALNAAGQNTKNFKSLIDSQRSNMQNWYQRIYTPIKKQVLDHIWADFLSTAHEMRRAKLTEPQPRSIGRHCSWCQFEPLCRAELQGLDVASIIEHEYVESTYEQDDSKD